jgi:HD-like signal output (HDOD) protein
VQRQDAITRKLCERTGHANQAQHAFLCGLLHDIGNAMCMIVLADQKPASSSSSAEVREGPPQFEKVFPAIRRVHESAGGVLGHLWHLPDEVTLVISSHHAVPRGNVMAAAVCVADWIATDLGFVVHGEVEAFPKEAMHVLGPSDVTLNDMKAQARGIVARIE